MRATTERTLLRNRMTPLLNKPQDLLSVAAGINRRVSLYSNTLDKNIISILITPTGIGKPDIIFYAEFNVIFF
jgi:hypothetical protein